MGSHPQSPIARLAIVLSLGAATVASAASAPPSPTAPTLLGPLGTLDGNAGSPAFTWSYRGPIAAPTFDLAIRNPATKALRLRAGVASGYRLPAALGLPAGCFVWQVRARDPRTAAELAEAAAPGDWSAPGELCLKRPAAPEPLRPDRGIGDTGGGPYTPTFTWSHPAAPANLVYDLSIRCLGSGTAIDKTGLAGTSYTLAGEEESLPADPSCQWTIRGRNPVTGDTTEEAGRSFNTLDVPAPAAVLYLGSAPRETSATPIFLLGHPHSLHQGSVSYDIEIFNPALHETVRRTALAGTFVDEETREVELDTPLPAGYSYLYFLRLRDDAYGTEGAWSESASFSVPLFGDLSPTAIGPLGAVSGPPSFEWDFAGGDPGTRYDLYLYNLSDDALAFSGTTELAGTRFDPGSLGLEGGKSYILWVRAKDSAGGGVGPWSDAAVFTLQ